MRATTFSTFALTAAALLLVVGLALRTGRAQTSNGDYAATREAHFPVLGLTRGDAARVHVVNLSTDMSGPALRFAILFLDQRGAPFKPEWDCEVRAGESCSAAFTSDECPARIGKPARCEFRAMVVAERLPPGTAEDAALWSTNVEVIDGKGATTVNAAPSKVLRVPIDRFPPGTDDPATDEGDGSDFPGSDFPGSDFPGSDFPGSDFPGSDFPGNDFPGSDFPGTDR